MASSIARARSSEAGALNFADVDLERGGPRREQGRRSPRVGLAPSVAAGLRAFSTPLPPRQGMAHRHPQNRLLPKGNSDSTQGVGILITLPNNALAANSKMWEHVDSSRSATVLIEGGCS